MERFTFWCRCLLALCVVQAALGLALVAFDLGGVPGPFNEAMNEAMWGRKARPDEGAAVQRFANAVLGATLVAWSVAIAFVAHVPFRAREPWAWTCVAVSVAVWFVLDTGCSIALGVWPNAILNAVCVVPFAVILAFTRRSFRG